MVVGHEEIFRVECGGRNRSSTLNTLEWGCPHRLGRKLLRDVMVMVMMTKNVSIVGRKHHGRLVRTDGGDGARAS